MKILITNHDLRFRGGSELFTIGLGEMLAVCGHTAWIYAPRIGAVAEGLKGATAFSALDQIPGVPDIIHGQHNLPTAAALCFFQESPAVYHCHGYEPLIERPFAHPRIYRYMGISSRFPSWIAKMTGCAKEEVETVYSGIHTERFARQSPVNETLRSALIYGHPRNFEKSAIEEIQTACSAAGIRLQIPSEKVTEPEAFLRQFDLVFATGRSAIEALCAGCCVIPFRRDTCGPMVLPENYDAQKVINFTVPAGSEPVTGQWLHQELKRHDSRLVEQISETAASDFSITLLSNRLVQIYERAIAAHSAVHVDIATEAKTLSIWLQTFAGNWSEEKLPLQEAELLAHSRALKEKLDAAREQLKNSSNQLQAAQNFTGKSWLHRLLTRSLRHHWRSAAPDKPKG